MQKKSTAKRASKQLASISPAEEQIMLDGSFRIPLASSDSEALGNVWCLMALSYEYIGRRFEMSAQKFPGNDHAAGDSIDVAHAQLRLTLEAIKDAQSAVEAFEWRKEREKAEARAQAVAPKAGAR